MTHTIELIGVRDEMLERLDRRARERHAPNRSEYILGLIRRDLADGNGVTPKTEKTMEEVLAPFHEAVRESGMTEEEVNKLLDETLKDVRRERRQHRMAQDDAGI